MTATPPAIQSNLRLIMPLSVYAENSVVDEHLQQHPIADKSSYASFHQEYDLMTAPLKVSQLKRVDRKLLDLTAFVDDVPANFLGFKQDDIEPLNKLIFVLDRSLNMLGVDVIHERQQQQQQQQQQQKQDDNECSSDKKIEHPVTITSDCVKRTVTVHVSLTALNPLGILALDYISQGCFIGTIFCRRDRRAIHNPDYIRRLKGVVNVRGHPVISSSPSASPWYDWKMEMVDGRVVVWVPFEKGVVRYGGEIHSLLPTVGMSLKEGLNMAPQIVLHQQFLADASRLCVPNDALIVHTVPFQFDCLFAKIVTSLLPAGVVCGSHNVLEPRVMESSAANVSNIAPAASRRTFVFSGVSSDELTHIPVEFFSLEAFREQVPAHLRKTLPARSVNVVDLSRAFASAPSQVIDGFDSQACVFLSKGSHFDRLQNQDWVARYPSKQEDHRLIVNPQYKLEQVTRYLHQQCEYPVLSAINIGDITSEGVLLTKYFPSPVTKSLLLSRTVTKKVRAVVFSCVSRSYGFFLSQEDRNLLVDLDSFGISVYYFSEQRKTLYQYTRRVNCDVGMFVPVERRQEYLSATFLGVYGSNLVEGNFEAELETMLAGLVELRKTCTHPLLNKDKPLALVTGGGPGAMEVGNRVAKKLGILSCGMIVDFGSLVRKPGVAINEQKQNPYVEAFMTYRPEKLVERQADFNLDLPLFLQGGVGTDFEYALEEVRRKVCTTPPNPMILFGDTWPDKITNRFQSNLKSGTIKGSEWLSNIPYVVSSGKQALSVLTKFFTGTLEVGPGKACNQLGFVKVEDE